MRIVLILLLLANLALFALTRLDSHGGEPQRIVEQLQPDKIKLLSPQEVAALGPAKTASLSDVCVEWGPLSESERARAMSEIAPLGVNALVSTRRIETEGFPVVLGGFPSRPAADRRLGELRARGIADLGIVDQGGGIFGVSLGSFRSEQAANGRADALAQAGVIGARVGPRRSGVIQSALVFRDPPQPALARLRELLPTYAGTEIKVGGCERTG